KPLYPPNFCSKILNSIQEGISIIDVSNYRIVDANRAFLRQVGLKRHQVIGRHCYEITHNRKTPCRPPGHPCPLVQTLKTVRPSLLEHVHILRNGRRVPFEVSASPIKDAKGRVAYVIHVARNIVSRKKLEQELIKLQQAVEASGEAIFMTDGKGVVTYINPAFTNLYGFKAREVVNKKTPRILKSGKMQPHHYRAFWRKILGGQVVRGEFINKTKSGAFLNIDGSANPIYDRAGGIVGFLAIQRDITDRKKTEARLNFLAHHDMLTGLLNRVLFHDRLGHAISAAERFRKIVAVMLLDIDYFKNVNDELGHSIGDRLLKSVAKRLRARVRKMDTVARLGGDEFAFVIPELQSHADATKVARKILVAFGRPFRFEHRTLRVTASIGISLYPSDGKNTEELVKNADIAMYRAKASGRSTYRLFKPAAQ
ncbi:MAG: diguanylate cyclase, partial [Actinobacteria bacterium]|nr:diguanylate cyclase [Actinomycetota bacterium]